VSSKSGSVLSRTKLLLLLLLMLGVRVSAQQLRLSKSGSVLSGRELLMKPLLLLLLLLLLKLRRLLPAVYREKCGNSTKESM
jgi:hypothetical protein